MGPPKKKVKTDISSSSEAEEHSNIFDAPKKLGETLKSSKSVNFSATDQTRTFTDLAADEDEDDSNEEIEDDSDSDAELGNDEFDLNAKSDSDGDEYDGSGSDTISNKSKKGQKRKNEPAQFATAMSKILTSHLTSSNRQNPILARSKESKDLDVAMEEQKLDLAARKALTAAKKEKLELGHIAILVPEDDATAKATLEHEKSLRKIAQRGVVKLFNAVRSAQLKADEVATENKGAVIGMTKRENKVSEMSKASFLDLIKAGGNTASDS